MWSHEFNMGSATHIVAAGLSILLMAAAALVGARWRGRAPMRERRLRITWVVLLIPFQLFSIAWWLLPANYDRTLSLPLHICDLVVWLVPIALLAEWRWPRTLVYFWGIGLSAWAFFVPVLERGPASPVFWLFWIGHIQIVGSAVYIGVAMGYRPRFRDLLIAVGAALAYVAVILPFDLLFDLDYGYVGRDTTSAVARLGDWPARVVLLVPIVTLLFAALWAPWIVLMRRESSSQRGEKG